MSIVVLRGLDFGSTVRITNLPDGVGAQEPATVAQLNAAIEGLNWKDSCRVSTQGNLNLAAPGATIDGITMAAGDRILVRSQTTASENGIYVWNGAATPATRSLDMNVAAEVEQATTTVEEGTNAGATYRQTAVNVTLGSTSLAWTTFGTAAGSATETSQGIIEIATQAETDTGTDAVRAVPPAYLKNSVWASRKFQQTFGDGSATSYVITHNLNTKDLIISIRETGGSEREVVAEVQRTSVNSVTVLTDAAPASNALRISIVS